MHEQRSHGEEIGQIERVHGCKQNNLQQSVTTLEICSIECTVESPCENMRALRFIVISRMQELRGEINSRFCSWLHGETAENRCYNNKNKFMQKCLRKVQEVASNLDNLQERTKLLVFCRDCSDAARIVVMFQLESNGTLRMSRVLHVPKMRDDLLSVSALEDEVYEVEFRDGAVLICSVRVGA